MTTKFINTSQRIAEDEGEFGSPVDAAAWLAGAVLAFQDAEEIEATVERSRVRDPNTSGSFMWHQPTWTAKVRATWREELEVSEHQVSIDMTLVAQALVDVSNSMPLNKEEWT